MKNFSSLSLRTKEPENGTLYIVGTPIGNMNDFLQEQSIFWKMYPLSPVKILDKQKK